MQPLVRNNTLLHFDTMTRNLIIAILLATSLPLHAQPVDARVDSVFSRWRSTDTPGAAIAVVHNGKVVHAKGYGMANLDHRIPIGASTVFDIASVSKQFGAMAIALLEQDGRVSLDDDVRKYIPELRDVGHKVTLRHLVHHTGGYRDWPGSMRIGGWSYHDVISFEQILRFAEHQRALNFPPGDSYAYSNTGYNLLAEVVQRVSGKTFREFTNERIFQPLGMTSTHFHDKHDEVVPLLAMSYRPIAGGTYAVVPNNLTALGSSSLYTTVEDLAKWIMNFDAPVASLSKTVQRMYQQGVLNNGDTIPYAFGQNVLKQRGLRMVTHGGSWAGYRSVLQRYPEQNFGVVILANTSDMNPGQLVNRIAELYLGDKFEAAVVSAPAPPARPAAERWTPTSSDLAPYKGVWVSDELLTSWQLDVRDGKLVATHLRGGETEFQPLARDRFNSTVFGEVRFERGSDGSVKVFTANSDRIRNLRFERR